MSWQSLLSLDNEKHKAQRTAFPVAGKGRFASRMRKCKPSKQKKLPNIFQDATPLGYQNKKHFGIPVDVPNDLLAEVISKLACAASLFSVS